MSLEKIINDIRIERHNQDEKWGIQHHPDGTAEGLKEEAESAKKDYEILAAQGLVTWRHILAEEFWEALSEVDEKKLRAELVQCGAVCIAWLEDIDSRLKVVK